MPKLSWAALLANHHSYKDIHKYVKGIPKDDPKTEDVDEGWETCCIQMSHAVNLAGVIIPSTARGIGIHQNNKNYVLNVPDMRECLNTNYKDPENFQGGARIALISQIIDRRGILAFGNRHIDLWNKTNIHRPAMYIMSAIWEAPSTLRDGIYFWEVE
jgi:hypothetical protein